MRLFEKLTFVEKHFEDFIRSFLLFSDLIEFLIHLLSQSVFDVSFVYVVFACF